MLKIIIVGLLICIFSIGPVAAIESDYDNGYVRGRFEAKTQFKETTSTLGLTLGFGAGLIGTGIAYLLSGGYVDAPIIPAKSIEYRIGYEKGFQETAKLKNQDAAVVGGLWGTFWFVVLYVSSSSRSGTN